MEKVLKLQVGNNTIIRHLHQCTCSVLTPLWTITAQHCLHPELHRQISKSGTIKNLYEVNIVETTEVIRYGSPSGEPTETDKIVNIIGSESLPTTRSRYSSADDILLLRTEKILLPKYGKISSVDFNALLGYEVVAVGYGNTNQTLPNAILKGTLELKKPLQVVKAMLSRCEDELYPSVCLYQTCGRPTSLCNGDSGGPVVHSSGIVALNSRAHVLLNCQMDTDDTRVPAFAIVTPVSLYVEWISARLTDNSYSRKRLH